MPDNATGPATAAGGGRARATTAGVTWLSLHGYVSASQAERCIAEKAAGLSDSELAYIDLENAIQFDIAAYCAC